MNSKHNTKGHYLTAVTLLLALMSTPVSGQSGSIASASLRPHRDCTPLEATRTSDPVAYSVYAGCVIDNNYSAFYYLYARYLRAFPNKMQDVRVRFKVGPDGRVEMAEAVALGVADTEFLRKFEARLKFLKFLSPGSEPREVTYEFTFSQDDRR